MLYILGQCLFAAQTTPQTNLSWTRASPSCCLHPDYVDLLHLPGGRGHNATALYDHKDGWGRVHHHPLPVLPRPLPSPLHCQLGVALPHRGLLRPDRCGVRRCADHFLLWFLLPLCYKRWVKTIAKGIKLVLKNIVVFDIPNVCLL